MPSYAPTSIKGAALEEVTLALIAKGAVELAPLPSPGFYSRLFVVWKTSGSWRPVIDLSLLNHSVDMSHFRRETIQSVLLSVRQGNWMASIDLREAYLQVPVHPESRHFLHFVAHGCTYQFTALCLGLSTAPQVFTGVMAPVSAILHSMGIRMRRCLLPGGSPPGSRGCLVPLSRVGDCNQPGEVQLLSVSGGPVSWGDHRRKDFYGFSIARSRLQAAVNRRRISVLHRASCQFMAVAAGDVVLSVTSGSRGPPADETAPGLPSPLMGSVASFGSCGVVSGLSSGPSVVAHGDHLSRGCLSVRYPGIWTFGLTLQTSAGGSLGRQSCFRPLGPVGGSSSSQCQGVAGSASRSPPLPVLSVRDHGGGVF